MYIYIYIYFDKVNDEGSIDFSQIRNELDRRWPQEEWIRAVVLRAVETCEGYNYGKKDIFYTFWFVSA